jgi:hypothetical protein
VRVERTDLVKGFCERGDESLGSVQVETFLTSLIMQLVYSIFKRLLGSELCVS